MQSHLTARRTLRPSRCSPGGHFLPRALAGPASCTHTSPAPYPLISSCQSSRPAPSDLSSGPPLAVQSRRSSPRAPSPLPKLPLTPHARVHARKHTCRPSLAGFLHAPTWELTCTPEQSSFPARPPLHPRAHLSRARTTQTRTLLPTRACPSCRARARTSPHRCTHFHTRAHLPSLAAQHSRAGPEAAVAQPLPRSLRSKNSAASSRRCTLIIRTRSMGSALPPPADRRRHKRLQSHDAPGHVRRAGGPARPRLGALSAALAVPAAPAAQPAARARFVYFSARARGRDPSSGEDRPFRCLLGNVVQLPPLAATALRESRDGAASVRLRMGKLRDGLWEL